MFTQHLVSSLSVNGCTVHRLRAACSAVTPGLRYGDVKFDFDIKLDLLTLL